ncbi:MAG: DUF6151 family protein [Pseudomonadota bacterium]
MTHDLEVSCRCGKLRGVARGVSPALVNRAKCYCDDCQLFAFFLGDPQGVLDEFGGSEICQMSPTHLELTEGSENLACVRLRPKGLYRWYAACCNTPMANTLTSAIPFVGVIRPGIKGVSDESVGPVRMRIHGRHAKGGAEAARAHPKAPLSAAFGILLKLLRRRFAGEHKRHPLFDPESGKAIVKPRVLEADELSEVQQARERWLHAD